MHPTLNPIHPTYFFSSPHLSSHMMMIDDDDDDDDDDYDDDDDDDDLINHKVEGSQWSKASLNGPVQYSSINSLVQKDNTRNR